MFENMLQNGTYSKIYLVFKLWMETNQMRIVFLDILDLLFKRSANTTLIRDKIKSNSKKIL